LLLLLLLLLLPLLPLLRLVTLNSKHNNAFACVYSCHGWVGLQSRAFGGSPLVTGGNGGGCYGTNAHDAHAVCLPCV
jgi:hypothetical protein